MSAPDDQGFGRLSPRELQVAKALAIGLTNQDIAEACGISIKTFDTHRQHVLKKLGLKNNVDIARAALRAGMVTL